MRYRKIRAIISGGGTGGHIFPALSIANKLKELNPETEILLDTSKSIDEKLLKNFLKECKNILFDCHKEEKFTRDWCENIIIESGANKGKGIPERTWKALFNNKILKDNKDNTFSFIEKEEKDGERQKHGFDFQVYAQKLFGLTKTSQTKKYTAIKT